MDSLSRLSVTLEYAKAVAKTRADAIARTVRSLESRLREKACKQSMCMKLIHPTALITHRQTQPCLPEVAVAKRARAALLLAIENKVRKFKLEACKRSDPLPGAAQSVQLMLRFRGWSTHAGDKFSNTVTEAQSIDVTDRGCTVTD